MRHCPHDDATHWPLLHIVPDAHIGLEQAPQCSGPSVRSKQPTAPVPGLQHTSVLGQALPPLHRQVLFKHCSPGRQPWPHAPQLENVLVVSTHVPPQQA